MTVSLAAGVFSHCFAGSCCWGLQSLLCGVLLLGSSVIALWGLAAGIFIVLWGLAAGVFIVLWGLAAGVSIHCFVGSCCWGFHCFVGSCSWGLIDCFVGSCCWGLQSLLYGVLLLGSLFIALWGLAAGVFSHCFVGSCCWGLIHCFVGSCCWGLQSLLCGVLLLGSYSLLCGEVSWHKTPLYLLTSQTDCDHGGA